MAIGTCVYFDGHNAASNAVTTRYRRWRKLNELVSTRHKGRARVAWHSLGLLVQVMYLGIVQWMNNSVRKIGKNKYLVQYTINGRLFKMVVWPRRGPVPVLQVSDEHRNDVTDAVVPYMGPAYDWHRRNVSPGTLGYASLLFELSNGESRFLNAGDVIGAL